MHQLTLDTILKFGNIAAWLILMLAFYFGDIQTGAEADAKLSERVTVVESQVHQEMLGYENIINSFGKRLERMERKLDCVMSPSLCGVAHSH